MSKECASGFDPILNTNSYTLTKDEFASIFGGGNDTVIEDFFYFGGETTIEIPIAQGFCTDDLGDYENISNLEILTSLLLIGGVVTTAIALLLPYLKIARNVRRFLQEARVCDCKKLNATDLFPDPSPIPKPDPNPVPPNSCCTACFQAYADIVRAGNEAQQAAVDAVLASVQGLERGNAESPPIQQPYQWILIDCVEQGLPCEIFSYVETAGFLIVTETGLPYLSSDTQEVVPWNTGTRLLYRDACDNEDQPTPTPTPTPTPLPPDSFDFCEQFPALCNACPDVGNSQDVVVSGKIASTCDVKDDISFNVKF